MASKTIQLSKISPVMLSFIVMGFVDIVGVSVGYVKKDFGLSDSLAQLIPSIALVWFFLLSVPVGILQDRFGKRNMLNLGMAMTGLGMLVPLFHYSFPVMLTAFLMLGIGNTIVQVSANPLLHLVVPENKFGSFMSLSQFVKAICSLMGPILATWFATAYGNWRIVFTVYAVTSLLAVLWLYFTKIEETTGGHKPASFVSCFKLLGNSFILILVIGIFLIVGSDVGMNSNIANYLKSTFHISLEKASLGISLYFTALMIGRFFGAVILNWIATRPFLILTSLLALCGLALMIFAPSLILAEIAIFNTGLGSANLFPLVFTIAVKKMPQRVNEISGLMIMAVAGGAAIPPLMGFVSQHYGAVMSIFILVGCIAYVFLSSLILGKK